MPNVKSPDKVKVAIIGGGCAALTAAFELTDGDNAGLHDVTIYQMGFRLGGKGASGRNRQHRNRTEEHGLHVWMGFYENAFRLMRRCYAELAPSDASGDRAHVSRYGDWQEAFIPDYWVGVAEPSRGSWRVWSSFFPAMAGLPGDPLEPDTNPFSLRGYLVRSCDLVRALIHSGARGPRNFSEDVESLREFGEVSPRAIVDKISSVVRGGVLAGAAALYEAMSVLQVVVSGRFSLPNGDYLVLKYAEAISANLRAQAEQLFATDDDLRPKLELVELVVTVIVGILRDNLLSDPDGLDAVNDEDCRVWLRRHGASARAVESPIVRALYDMAFADGKSDAHDEPGLAAGQALRGALRMFFTYRGSLFWKLRAGMGDVVFAPLYEVLKKRGVKFEFFHELTNVITDGSRVTELHFNVQARPKAADPDWRGKHLKRANPLQALALRAGEYYPLDEDGCWPSAPQLDQIATTTETDFEIPCAENSRERREPTIVRGDAFDCVVLGASLGALATACPALLESDERFAAMSQKVKTINTQALQLWFTDGLDRISPCPAPITVAGFQDPFDTWSDMTHVIAEERWPANEWPKGLVYFCGVLPYDQTEAEAEAAALSYIDEALPQIWPQTRRGRTHYFDWNLLARFDGSPPPTGPHGAIPHSAKQAHLASQYFKRNVNPSDRYVLTRPGTTRYRISPLDCAYENLTIAGDWTDCGFNEGCVEAAVMSGMLAAHAICRYPALEDIVGFDHP